MAAEHSRASDDTIPCLLEVLDIQAQMAMLLSFGVRGLLLCMTWPCPQSGIEFWPCCVSILCACAVRRAYLLHL
jgi:hypothetical protein